MSGLQGFPSGKPLATKLYSLNPGNEIEMSTLASSSVTDCESPEGLETRRLVVEGFRLYGLYTEVYRHIHICIYVCICIYVYIYICVCVRIHYMICILGCVGIHL